MTFRNLSPKTLLIVILPALLISAASLRGTFQAQEYFFYDLYMQLRPAQKVSDNIAIIEIDDKTLKHLGQWPLPRDFHASLIDTLQALGAKRIVFDLIFSEQTDQDEAFSASIQKMGQVYLPEVYDVPVTSSPRQVLENPHAYIAPLTKSLAETITAKGHINIFVDIDGKIRSAPLFIKHQGSVVPQLGLQAACGYLGLDCAHTRTDPDLVVLDGRLNIPVTDTDQIWVNYPGRWKNTFQHFSYLEILVGYKNWFTQKKDLGRLSQLKDKTCFVGLTATGTSDLGVSPLESNYPMVGLNASIFNSLVTGQFLERASGIVNLFVGLMIYLLALWIGILCRPRKALFGSIFLAASFILLTGLMFWYAGIWINVFLPLFILLLVYMSCVSLRWAKERHQREMLEKEILIAQKIQMQFLKGPGENTQDQRLAVWFKPARYVSGDCYDVSPLAPDTTGIFLGDVSGKGLSAALCMAEMLSLFRIFSQKVLHPEQVLIRLNKELCFRNAERFVTSLYCIIDHATKNVAASSAGHGPIFVYRAQSQSIEEITFVPRAPLGIDADTVYEHKIFSIAENDKIIFLSDGFTEARNAKDEELGIDRVKECLVRNASYSNKDLLEALKTLMFDHSQENPQHDDMTLIIFSLRSLN